MREHYINPLNGEAENMMTGWRTVRVWGQNVVEWNENGAIWRLNAYGLEGRIRHCEAHGIDVKDEREALGALEAAAMTEAGLFELLNVVDSPEGRSRLDEYLKTTPFPHYEAASGKPERLVRIEADGRRAVGRFVGREWKVEDH